MVDTLGNAPSECKDSDFTGRTASLTGYVSTSVRYSQTEYGCVRLDSNQRPPAYEAGSLTTDVPRNKFYGPFCRIRTYDILTPNQVT